MQARQKCVKCGSEIIFQREDVRQMTEEEKQFVLQSNKDLLDEYNRKEKRKFLFWQWEEDKYTSWGKSMVLLGIRNVVGILKCPICDNEQYILRGADNYCERY